MSLAHMKAPRGKEDKFADAIRVVQEFRSKYPGRLAPKPMMPRISALELLAVPEAPVVIRMRGARSVRADESVPLAPRTGSARRRR